MKPTPIVPTEGDRAAARGLVRAADHAALATTTPEGIPLATLAATATDHRGQPLLLLSTLAPHTRNLLAAPTVSLLFEETRERPNPQTKGRVSLIGEARRLGDEEESAQLWARYLARHPSAALYAGFADFSLYRVEVRSAHYVAGFGRAMEFGPDILVPTDIATAFGTAEADLLDALESADAARLANRLLKRRGRNWTVAAVDADGLDLALKARVCRLPFPRPLDHPDEVREEVRSLLAIAGH